MINLIRGFTIDQVWREAITKCYHTGYKYVIEKGSYEGETRIQFPAVAIEIIKPWIRPLAPILPPTLPPVTTDEKIEEYFMKYLMNPTLAINEEYKYASWIVPQLPDVIKMLQDSHGNTNQATITVGDSFCTKMKDPPCLKLISFKVVELRLQMSVFFRSWDLVAGLPQNLGGLQLLKEYVLSHLDLIIDGQIYAYSDGLHLYYPLYKAVVDQLIIKESN